MANKDVPFGVNIELLTALPRDLLRHPRVARDVGGPTEDSVRNISSPRAFLQIGAAEEVDAREEKEEHGQVASEVRESDALEVLWDLPPPYSAAICVSFSTRNSVPFPVPDSDDRSFQRTRARVLWSSRTLSIVLVRHGLDHSV